ncbi:c-type cytochrome [Xanthobacter pseudotagetidis]|uniref:c-type cytochrome n=1 Tax=Xanthobacter pseudotagetidis TaxID=3119911 RepID=UPI00372CBED2
MPHLGKFSSAICLAAAALAASAALAAPVHRPDATAGRALAERWCVGCHVVGPGQQRAASDAPTFAALAARDGDIAAAWLAFRLLKPHPQMPQLALSRDEAADLAAYFASLRK